MSRPLLSAVFCGLVLVGLAGCASPQSEPTLPPLTNADGSFKLGSFLKALRQKPSLRPTASAICIAALEQESKDVAYYPFIASFFDVPLDDARGAFCEALIESVFSDALTDDDLIAIDSLHEASSYGAVGKLLRQMLIAHENAGSELVLNLPPQR